MIFEKIKTKIKGKFSEYKETQQREKAIYNKAFESEKKKVIQNQARSRAKAIGQKARAKAREGGFIDKIKKAQKDLKKRNEKRNFKFL